MKFRGYRRSDFKIRFTSTEKICIIKITCNRLLLNIRLRIRKSLQQVLSERLGGVAAIGASFAFCNLSKSITISREFPKRSA